jgi:hypothetical protein
LEQFFSAEAIFFFYFFSMTNIAKGRLHLMIRQSVNNLAAEKRLPCPIRAFEGFDGFPPSLAKKRKFWIFGKKS